MFEVGQIYRNKVKGYHWLIVYKDETMLYGRVSCISRASMLETALGLSDPNKPGMEINGINFQYNGIHNFHYGKDRLYSFGEDITKQFEFISSISDEQLQQFKDALEENGKDSAEEG